MIYNCKNCCKAISTKSEICPYCKCDAAETALLIEKALMQREHGRLGKIVDIKEKLKGTLASLKF